jgi:hypothetical protein
MQPKSKVALVSKHCYGAFKRYKFKVPPIQTLALDGGEQLVCHIKCWIPFPPGKSSHFLLDRRLVGARSDLDFMEQTKLRMPVN